MVRVPANFFINGYKFISNSTDFYKPSGLDFVNQFSMTAVAERVTVKSFFFADEKVIVFKKFNNILIGFPNISSFEFTA